jgi:hypothetical protein
LKGISTGDMMPALEALRSPHTPGLFATNIIRLKRVWEMKYRLITNSRYKGLRRARLLSPLKIF